MDILIFVKGIILGFLIAAPVGPIGILCIKRSLDRGPLSGFLTGLGAASADAFYGFIAAFGIAALSEPLLRHSTVIQVAGIIFLLYLGQKIFRETPSTSKVGKGNDSGSLAYDYASSLALTITNPVTILSFAAAFAGLGALGSELATAWALVAGVFTGSLIWWVILSSFVGSLLRRYSSDKLMLLVSKASGLTLIAFAVYLLAGLIT